MLLKKAYANINKLKHLNILISLDLRKLLPNFRILDIIYSMWILLNDATLSVVEDRRNPKYLRVRSRVKGDIERVFPSAVVLERWWSDYRFCAILPRRVVAEKMVERITSIDYDNFKDSVQEKDRADMYTGIWAKILVWARGKESDDERLRDWLPPRLTNYNTVETYHG